MLVIKLTYLHDDFLASAIQPTYPVQLQSVDVVYRPSNETNWTLFHFKMTSFFFSRPRVKVKPGENRDQDKTSTQRFLKFEVVKKLSTKSREEQTLHPSEGGIPM